LASFLRIAKEFFSVVQPYMFPSFVRNNAVDALQTVCVMASGIFKSWTLSGYRINVVQAFEERIRKLSFRDNSLPWPFGRSFGGSVSSPDHIAIFFA
jgi:hypothetical protein